MDRNHIHEIFQSVIKPHHITEKGLVKVINNLLLASDQDSIYLLILVDLIVIIWYHDILLDRLENVVGVKWSKALSKLKSCQTSISFFYINSALSMHTKFKLFVPQDSVVGLLLFPLSMLWVKIFINMSLTSTAMLITPK